MVFAEELDLVIIAQEGVTAPMITIICTFKQVRMTAQFVLMLSTHQSVCVRRIKFPYIQARYRSLVR